MGSTDERGTDIFAGHTEMHGRIRAHDWAGTPLGPVEAWPQSLKVLIKTLLASRYPMVLTWGPDFLQFYNDAYSQLIGDKHPAALGIDIRITLAEAWDTLGPMIGHVMETGVANWTPALRLLLFRAGYREESYFSVSHAPAEDDDGRIVGMLAVCSEVTDQVLGERRLRLLRDLASRAGDTRTVERTGLDLSAAIAGHPLDLPFALIYLRDGQGGGLTLQGAVGLPAGRAASPFSIPLPAGEGEDGEEAGKAGPWPFARALAGETVLVEGLEARLHLAGGPWDDPVHQALVMPIASADQAAPLGVLVAGLSPNRALDEGYRSFFELLAGQVSVALRNARAHEDERRRAEALAELNRARTTFFSNVSHEFRTPLTLILGPVADALARPERSLGGEGLETVHRSTLRLLKLVNTLLESSRLEAGRSQAALEPTDLSTLTVDLASSFRSLIEGAGIRFTVDCPPMPGPVWVDRSHWEKIVLNLLSNAYKFTLEGEIAVTLRPEAGGAVLSVRDTGTGIPEAELPHLFERFYRVRGARGRTIEGTGIGLALVRELVSLQGGTVRVTSGEGAGSTFMVSIPATPPPHPVGPDRSEGGRDAADEGVRIGTDEGGRIGTDEAALPFVLEAARWGARELEPAGERIALPATGTEPPARGRILVADDNADMRDYLVHLLREQWEVEAVGDGATALERALAHPPALVLSDVMMPGLDGVGLLRGLRAEPKTAAIPVVLLSARAGEEAVLEGLETGADDYLVKPFSARELLTRVRTHVEMAGLRQRAVAAAREIEAIHARDEFLSIASHELKTPLTALQLQIATLERKLPQLSLDHRDAAWLSDRLSLLRRQGNRLARLVNLLLELSRSSEGRPTLHLERVALTEVVRQVITRLEEDEPGGRARERIRIDIDPAVIGRWDQARMDQIVTRLLENALKFGEGRPIGIEGRLEGGTAVLKVCDQGIGIAREDQERIFGRFERAVSERHFGGLGVGLWLTRQVVEAMGGTIMVESRPGHGATFVVRLPLEGPDTGALLEGASSRDMREV